MFLCFFSIFRDALVVSLGNCLTSFFAGFVIFGIIGFMAHEMGMPVDKVAKQGMLPSHSSFPGTLQG